MLHIQNNRLLPSSPQDLRIVMRTKIVTHILFEVVICNRDDKLLLFIPHGLRLNTEVYIKCLCEVVLSSIKKLVVGRPKSGNKILRHDTKSRESSVLSDKIPASTSPLTSGHLTLQSEILLIIMGNVRKSDIPTKFRAIP